MPAHPRERNTIANGMRLHYLEWGDAAAPVLVFIHGAAHHAHTWDPVCAAFADRYRCIAIDLRGHGDSEWSPVVDYSPASFAADIDALLEQLGPRRYVLVGQSVGGMVAMSLAAAHPDRAAALVAIDIVPETREAGRARIRSSLAVSDELESVDAFVAEAAAKNPLRAPDELRRLLAHNLRPTPRGTWTWKYDRRLTGARRAENARAWTPAERWALVGQVRCPTLILRGSRSEIVHDEDAARVAETLRDGRWTRIEGAGHSVHIDQPAAVTREIRSFLESLPPSNAIGAG